MTEESVVVPAHTVMGRGEPVVFVAGTAFPGATWTPRVLAPYLDHLQVITFDFRGTGQTPATDARYSTRLFARDVVALLDHLGIEAAHVVGHSFGGRVAQWVGLDAPERVCSLALVSSGGGQPGSAPAPAVSQVELVRRSIDEEGFEGFMRRALSEFLFDDAGLSEGGAAVAAELFEAFWAGRPTPADYLRHVVARQEHRTLDLVGALRPRTMVLVGEDDTLPLASGSHYDQAVTLAEHIPGAVFTTLPNLAHGLFWEDPATCAAVLRSWFAEGR